MLNNLFSALTSKIFGGIAIAAIGFAGVQTARIEGFLFFDGYKDVIASLNKTIGQMESAGVAATLAQITLNASRTATETKIAKGVDHEYQIKQNDAHNAAVRYIERNRVRDAKSCSSEADNPTENSIAASGESPHDNAVMVSVSDFNICTENSVRLQSVSKWADDLIQAGVAE